jgi:hypothetical protein
MVNGANAIGATLYASRALCVRRWSWRSIHRFRPIRFLSFIAYAQANPGKIRLACANIDGAPRPQNSTRDTTPRLSCDSRCLTVPTLDSTEAADPSSATSRQILRAKQTCHDQSRMRGIEVGHHSWHPETAKMLGRRALNLLSTVGTFKLTN